MTKKRFFLTLSWLLCTGAIVAQTAERRAGELLVQLRADASPATVLQQVNRSVPQFAPMRWKAAPAPAWQIYLLEFNESGVDPSPLLDAVRGLPDVQTAQWNFRTAGRIQPSDPSWGLQNDMTLISMPDAWDVATGGLTPAGDTIVVAVLEKGALLSHPDLAANVWYNWGEIAGNGLDDDANGYKDDFRGWNYRKQNDDLGEIDFHGTAVHGIIGAKANNGEGVSGVNWNVKLMHLSNTEYESEIIAAYNYAADMRRLYNESGGSKGAFIVATNASFGIDYEPAAAHPIWCAVYDSLGKVGVLSVGATSNENINVDEEGDMPSTCPSQYLITVNSVDKFDKKMLKTGVGKINIDLAGPGISYTTLSQGLSAKYGTFEGTSGAAPHVTGAVALLYSLDCLDLTADVFSDPAQCARRMRDFILENVSPNTTLTDLTSTGGRLDVAASVKAVQDRCGGTSAGPLEILWVRPNPVHSDLRVHFQAPTFTPYHIRVFNMLGQLMFEDTVDPDPFSANVWKYDVSLLPAGVYGVSFGRNDAWRSEKFVKN